MVNAKAFQESQSCGWVVASRGLQRMSKFCTLRPVLSEMTPHNIEVQHCARGNNDACQITEGKITTIRWSPQITSCTQPSSKNAHSVLKFYTTCVQQGFLGGIMWTNIWWKVVQNATAAPRFHAHISSILQFKKDHTSPAREHWPEVLHAIQLRAHCCQLRHTSPP